MHASPDRITSASNPLIKLMRSLDRKKHRADSGLFLAEGTRLVTQALEQDWEIDTLIVSSSGLGRESVSALLERAAPSGARLVEVPDRLAATISRKDNPQAVLAAIRQKPLTLDRLDPGKPGLWIGLYEVRDPGNLGTILRTADCAGAAGIVLIGQCCDPYSVEAVRASMGSLFDVDLAQAPFDAFDTWRQAAGLGIVAASINGNRAHTQVDFTRPSLILMGNEQAGLPDAIEARCETLCRIPMRGGADSLNLAQATAIMLYEGWRQRDFA